jgi:hypothetical protein
MTYIPFYTSKQAGPVWKSEKRANERVGVLWDAVQACRASIPAADYEQCHAAMTGYVDKLTQRIANANAYA